jgi:ribonucleoside-diphosphate reductase alpha subunit
MLLYVIDRHGVSQKVKIEKIQSRIEKLCKGLNSDFVDPALVAQKAIQSLKPGITTSELDQNSADIAVQLYSVHPDYSLLATRILVSNLHKNTKPLFSDVISDLHNYKNPITGKHCPQISKYIYDAVQTNKDILNAAIDHEKDLENYDFFAYKTIEHSYLMNVDNKIVERVQHFLMRVACGIHTDLNGVMDINSILETYYLISEKWFTHSTPINANAGKQLNQLSSCFLLSMYDDSIEGIYDTLKSCAILSKHGGGIGFSVSNIRASGSYIAGTNGYSSGIIPMLRVFNNTARYVDQGGNKRKGAFSVYLEPWHVDVEDLLDLSLKHGNEEARCRDLFSALWIPDLFMERVQRDEDWCLFCPNEAPGLCDTYGEEFNHLYENYEKQPKLIRKKMKARDLWKHMINSKIESGSPYFMFKDACNKKSNQKNLGTIKCSNLCTEIVQYTSKDEVAVCNLASISLSKFVREDKTFDFERLIYITKVITRNLNKVIDVGFYPEPKTRASNLRHRPIGIGVQGLADAFILMRYPFTSNEARQLNKDIFETIYYAALSCSMELAQKHGPYDSIKGSPVEQGIFQFDLWDVTPSERYNWSELKEKVKLYGVRNSLLVAPMPTATTSQMLGNVECFEPLGSNIYIRRTNAGEFKYVNSYLVKDLQQLGLWNKDMKDRIIIHKGSVQYIEEIPLEIRELYKTVWEIDQKAIINMAADRGPFIDQSQSMNIHMRDASYSKMTSCLFHAWNKGLKTGMYYLRTKSAVDAIQVTVDPNKIKEEHVKIQLNSPSPPDTPATPSEITRQSSEESLENSSLSNESLEPSSSNEGMRGMTISNDKVCYLDKEGCMTCGS